MMECLRQKQRQQQALANCWPEGVNLRGLAADVNAMNEFQNDAAQIRCFFGDQNK